MKMVHPVFFHVSGHTLDISTVIALRRTIYWSQLRAHHSGIQRRFVWGGADTQEFAGVGTNQPAVLPEEYAYHVWVTIPRPWDDPFGAGFMILDNGDAACRIWMPPGTRIDQGGYNKLWFVTTTDHEFGHCCGVGVPRWSTEVYKLEQYTGIFNAPQWEECMKFSPMRGSGWDPNLTMEQLMARNVFAPHEAFIIDGNYRAGHGLPELSGWERTDGSNPTPAIQVNGEWVSVFRSQAGKLGNPGRMTAPLPTDTLAPYPSTEPPLPADLNRGKTEIIRHGRDFEIVVKGTLQGSTYHLIGCHGDRDNPEDWRHYGTQVAGPDGQVSFLVSNPTDPVCMFEVITAEGTHEIQTS